MAKKIKTKEKTPNGGDYSEIIFFDNDGNIVDESKAVRCVIRECDSEDNLIHETFGTV